MVQHSSYKHGESQFGETPEYRSWRLIKERCDRTDNQSYSRYGGRGIRMCSRLRESVLNFLESVGRRPTLGHSIDRVDNDGHYSCGSFDCEDCRANDWPMNMRWADRKEQARNRTSTHYVEVDGKRMSLAEAVDNSDLNYDAVVQRLRSGWEPEAALKAPFGHRRRTTVYRTADGTEKTLTQLAKESGICYGTLRSRIVINKWSVEDAISKPVRGMKRTRNAKQ